MKASLVCRPEKASTNISRSPIERLLCYEKDFLSYVTFRKSFSFDLGIHGDRRFAIILKIFIEDKGIKIPASESHPGCGTPDRPVRPVQGHE